MYKRQYALFLISFYLPKVKLQNSTGFYSFGGAFGDTLCPKNDDGSFGPIKLGVSIPFFNNVYQNLFVNTNGVISFLFPINSSLPLTFPMLVPLIAVFWNDLNPLINGQIYYRESSSTSDLNQTKSDVLKAYPGLVSFSPSRAYIITWDRVSAYGGSSSATNTFQAVISTDGIASFLIFNFGSVSLLSKSIQIGGNSGDGVNFYRFPDNLTISISSISTLSNVNVPGKWVFKVDSLSSPTNPLTTTTTTIASGPINLSGHSKYISSLAVLDDRTLASSSGDTTIKLWNLTSYTLIRTLTGHTRDIQCISALPDGTLASGSYDNTIKIWDPKSGVMIRSFSENVFYVSSLLVLKDGTLASGGGYDIIIYNYNTGKSIITLKGHTGSPWALVQLRDETLASGADDSSVKIWNVKTGQLIRTILGHSNWLFSLSELSDGSLVSGYWYGIQTFSMKIWNPSNGSLIRTLAPNSESTYSLCLLRDNTLASGSGDGLIKIWNTKTGDLIRTLPHPGRVWALKLLKDGRLVSGSDDRIVKIWT